MENDEIVKQLTQIYLREEKWHSTYLDEESANEYHKELLQRGNILSCSQGDLLLGYVEFWRINYEQFGRIICGEGFSALCEDVIHGYIAYVANTYIRPEYRKGEVYKMLRDRFFEFNKDCTYFVGHARRKKSEPVKVFKVKDISLRKVEV